MSLVVGAASISIEAAHPMLIGCYIPPIQLKNTLHSGKMLSVCHSFEVRISHPSSVMRTTCSN